MTSAADQQALRQAVAFHRAGDLGHAEALYRQVLLGDPNQVDALHNLGLLALKSDRASEAVELIGRAIGVRPGVAVLHGNLSRALAAVGQVRQALASARRAVELDPGDPQAQFNLGNVLRQLDQVEGPESYDGMGDAPPDHRLLDEAIAVFRKAIALKPDFAEVHCNFSGVLNKRGMLEAARESAKRALSLRDDIAAAWMNLGLAEMGLGRAAEAEAALRRTLSLDGESADTWYNFANLMLTTDRPDDAIKGFERAIALRPSFASAHNNLGIALRDAARLDDSVASFRRSLAVRPGYALSHVNLSATLWRQGRVLEAIDESRNALRCDPTFSTAQRDIAYMIQFHPDDDAQGILKEGREFNRAFAAPLAREIRPHNNDPNPDRRLRVGYVGADFRRHVLALFELPLLAAHDHARFEIYCYSNVPRPDAVTEHLRQFADVWRHVTNESDQRLAEIIRADAIDVLVDLTMYMIGSRALMFARKPAPVQLTWIACPGTMGLDAMDYRLTDPYLDPPGEYDEDYSEESIRLRDTFWIYEPRAREIAINDFPAVKANALPALEAGHITFGCMNNFCKVNDPTLNMWAAVMRAIPTSRLILTAPAGSSRVGVLETLARLGVAGDRIEFVAFQPTAQYLQTYQRIDVTLDTFPYNGHTTSLDSFWMGVPVITLMGRTAVSRAGWSQLNNLGLTELAVRSIEQFVGIATELATDLPRLSTLRATLRDRMEKSPLMDAPRFARSMEAAYRQMWQTWCAGPGRRGAAS